MEKSIFPYELISKEDRDNIENKYHRQGEKFDPKKRMKHHGYDYDKSTGLSDEKIIAELDIIADKLKKEHHYKIKSELFSFILENTMIDINEHDYFVGMYTWDRVIDKNTVDKWQKEVYKRASDETPGYSREDYCKSGTAWAHLDFDHTVPDWTSLCELGFTGILERLNKSFYDASVKGTLTEKKKLFYKCAKTEYEALIKFTKRLYEYSLTKNHEKAKTISDSLKNLCYGPPKTMYDCLQMIYIYFMVSESVEHYQVRSLGYGLDGTLYPFYKKDLESGIYTKEELSRFIAYFLMQFSSMGNYWGQPFYLGGCNIDGSTAVNELSYLILDIFDSLGLYNPKIQIKVSNNTPKSFFDQSFRYDYKRLYKYCFLQ